MTVPINLMRDVSFDTIKMPFLMVIFPQVRVRNYNQLLFGNIAYAMAFVMILPLTMGFFFFNNSIHHRFDRQRPKFTVHHIPREPPACPSTFHSLLLSAFPITENSITLFLYSKSKRRFFNEFSTTGRSTVCFEKLYKQSNKYRP